MVDGALPLEERSISHAMLAGRPTNRPVDVIAETNQGEAVEAVPGGPGRAIEGRSRLPENSDPGIPPGPFSAQVRSRLSSNSRTGQACDRCKVRKIKCDSDHDACSNCRKLGEPCLVTDRVTGRTEIRGYVKELEKDKRLLGEHVQNLEKLLLKNDIEVIPLNNNGNLTKQLDPSSAAPDPSGQSGDDGGWSRFGTVWARESRHKPAQEGQQQQTNIASSAKTKVSFRPRPAGSHMGVATEHAPLSSINGAHLSILGATIDITALDGADTAEEPTASSGQGPLYNKSMRALLMTMMKMQAPPNVGRPSRERAFQYFEWYFRTSHPFLPILHRPTCMALVARFYDDPRFQPSAAELVIIHVVFAFMIYQSSVRNEVQDYAVELNERSNQHYHFALSMFFHLATDKSLKSLQAIALLAVHCRCFPKPECGSIISHWGLNVCVNLNLHRKSATPSTSTKLEIEMGKRVWWSMLALCVSINGRLGRPMPLNIQDFDIELPEPIPDEPLAASAPPGSKCDYEVGIAGFQLVPLMMQTYSSLYTAKRNPGDYAEIINSIEEQLAQWKSKLPDYLLRDPATIRDHTQMQVAYLHYTELELRLSLRHPSVAMTTDSEIMAENTRICEDVATRMLGINLLLSKKKSLDSTWFSISVYVAAMFTTLAAHWERRLVTTTEQLNVLRDTMNSWLDVVMSGASLSGPQSSLRQELDDIVKKTLSQMEREREPSNPDLAPSTSPNVKPELGEVDSGAQRVPAPRRVSSNRPVGPAAGKKRRRNTQNTYDQASSEPSSGVAYAAAVATTGGAQYAPSLPYLPTPAPYDESSNPFLYYNTPPLPGSMGNAQPNMGATPLMSFTEQSTQQMVEPPPSTATSEQFLSKDNTPPTALQDWFWSLSDSQNRYRDNNQLLSMGVVTAGANLQGQQDEQAAQPQVDTSQLNTSGIPSSTAPQWPTLLWDQTD